MRWFKLVVLLIASWCVMVTAHELGHLVGGWASGGTLLHSDLRPWRLPYSMFEPDPHPLVTLWAGPLLGIMLPGAFAWLIRRPSTFFIASFCLLANGCYLLIAWITGDRWLDTSRLFAAGASSFSVIAYCVLTVIPGYVLFRTACVRLLAPHPKVGAASAGGSEAS
jgi:hypothetical protein